jgi:hypothetical protein
VSFRLGVVGNRLSERRRRHGERSGSSRESNSKAHLGSPLSEMRPPECTTGFQNRLKDLGCRDLNLVREGLAGPDLEAGAALVSGAVTAILGTIFESSLGPKANRID